MLIRPRLILLSIVCILLNKYTIINDIRNNVSIIFSKISLNTTLKLNLYLDQTLNINKDTYTLSHENSLLQNKIKSYKKELEQNGVPYNKLSNSNNYANRIFDVNKNGILTYNNQIEINYPSNNAIKIELGQGVINSNSAIGKIILTNNSFAIIELLSAPNVKSYGQLVKSNYKLLLNGIGNGFFEIIGLDNSISIKIGDTIETTGLDQLFPAHYNIAEVYEISTDKNMNKRVICKSAINLSEINYVMVLEDANI